MLDATQRKGWGGVGDVNVPCTLHMLDATQLKGWGGVWHVNIPCTLHMLDATQLKGWGGVGHVNVPCTLHTCWMLRYGRVGVGWGMLTFFARCTHVGCYATEGLGWGGAC